jgi:chromosomal replication initiator protein
MSDPDGRVWPDVIAHLQKHYPDRFRHWFNDLEPSGLNAGVVTVRAQNPTWRDYLEHHCAEAFDDALRTVLERLVSARFVGPDGSGAPPPPPRAPVEHEPRGQWRDEATQPLVPDHSFENFVVSPDTRLAHAAAVAVAARPGRAYNPLFIHGAPGLGKTHLLQAICLEMLEKIPGSRVLYTSSEHFVNRFLADVRVGRMHEFRTHFRGVDALVIDDIQFLTSRELSQQEFFHTFNTLFEADKQIVVSGDTAPESIPGLEERLVSRFRWGLVAEVAPPGYESRVEIIKAKGRLRGIEISNDVAEFIAQHEQRNIREIQGHVTTVQHRAIADGVDPITVEVARLALGDPPASAAARVSLERIIEEVTRYYDVRPADLQGRKRNRSVVVPRHVGMYLARKYTHHSLDEIGGYFGGRDHATVINAIRKVTEEAKGSLAASMVHLEGRLRAAGRDR